MTTPPPALRAAEAIEGMIRPQCPPIYQDEIKHIITSEFAPMVEALKQALEDSNEILNSSAIYHEAREQAHAQMLDNNKALQLLKETK